MSPLDLTVEEVTRSHLAALDRAMDDHTLPQGYWTALADILSALLESKRLQSSLEADSELMKELQTYKARWLECVTPEEAQRLRDENARLKEELAAHTHGVTPASEDADKRALEWLDFECERDYFGQREAIHLREMIGRLTPSPAEQAQMKLNKEARDRRKAAGYDDDAWRGPST